jgi:hypothetical protein
MTLQATSPPMTPHDSIDDDDEDDDDDVNNSSSSSFDFYHQHNDFCEVCGQPGLLLCCAACNIVSHIHCAGLQEAPLNDWMCAYCLADDNPSEGQPLGNNEVDLLALVDELYLAECERDNLRSITINDVHRAVAQRLGLGDEPLDRKRKKLVKGRLMDMITGEVVPSAVVVAAVEDVVIDDNDTSKKCKEAGGAQDSIDDVDDDNDDNDDDNFEAGDCDHEVHCTIRNDEVSIVPVKDIDILTRRKNSDDKMEYKNLGGNVWLKQLCKENVEEYSKIVGKHEYLRKNFIVTTIINQLANENQRILQMRNGEWAQLKEPDVRTHIYHAMSHAKRKMNITVPVVDVPVIKSRFWKDSEEKRLRDWYSKKNFDISRIHSEDYAGIAEEMGSSETACKKHLKQILRNGLSEEDVEGLISNWSKKKETDANVPSEFVLPRLCNMEGMTNNFTKNLSNNMVAIHITQIPPNKLATFDKDTYLRENAEAKLDDIERNYIEEHHGKKCIMPDNTARVLHNFDEQTGGAENPHIRDPDTGVFRKFINSDVFVSNNIPRALRKYRTANDREIHYGNDRGRFSLFCYGYIFEAINIKQAKFIDVGIGRNQGNGQECTGQSPLPVMPRGCYKITYNGMGIQNATATWVPL